MAAAVAAANAVATSKLECPVLEKEGSFQEWEFDMLWCVHNISPAMEARVTWLLQAPPDVAGVYPQIQAVIPVGHAAVGAVAAAGLQKWDTYAKYER